MDRFMTRQQLAKLLGIGTKKLTNLIEDNQIEVEPRKLIPPKIQDEIKKKLGVSDNAFDDDKPNRFGFKKR